MMGKMFINASVVQLQKNYVGVKRPNITLYNSMWVIEYVMCSGGQPLLIVIEFPWYLSLVLLLKTSTLWPPTSTAYPLILSRT